MSKKTDLHLTVRKTREYSQLQREIKERRERVKALEALGTADPNELVTEGAKAIAKAIKVLPESLMRKAVHLAVTMAIPKSPRGRKPTKAHAHS